MSVAEGGISARPYTMVFKPEMTCSTLETAGGCGMLFEVEPVFAGPSGFVYVYSTGFVTGILNFSGPKCVITATMFVKRKLQLGADGIEDRGACGDLHLQIPVNHDQGVTFRSALVDAVK